MWAGRKKEGSPGTPLHHVLSCFQPGLELPPHGQGMPEQRCCGLPSAIAVAVRWVPRERKWSRGDGEGGMWDLLPARPRPHLAAVQHRRPRDEGLRVTPGFTGGCFCPLRDTEGLGEKETTLSHAVRWRRAECDQQQGPVLGPLSLHAALGKPLAERTSIVQPCLHPCLHPCRSASPERPREARTRPFLISAAPTPSGSC